MPFTVSHAAVATFIPARARGWIIPGAVAAGAVSPDAGYYLPLHIWPGTGLTHSIIGAVTIDAAFGVLAYLLWRTLLRRPLLSLLPEPLSAAALSETDDIRRGRTTPLIALLICASSALGALTHVLLDVLTHEGRSMTPDVINDVTILGQPLAWVLQVTLSLIGLALIAVWTARWVRRHRASLDSAPLRWPRETAYHGLLLAMLLGLAAGCWRILPLERMGPRAAVVQWTFGFGFGLTIGLIGWSAIWHVTQRRAVGR